MVGVVVSGVMGGGVVSVVVGLCGSEVMWCGVG